MRFDEIRNKEENQIDELLPALARAGAAVAKSGLGRKAIAGLAGIAGAGQAQPGQQAPAPMGRPAGPASRKTSRPDDEPTQTAAPLPVATGNMPPGPPPTTTGGVQKATAPAQQAAQPNAQADPEVAKAQKAADQQAKANKKLLQKQVQVTKLQLQQMQKQLQGMK